MKVIAEVLKLIHKNNIFIFPNRSTSFVPASIAQLGERKTEDLEALCSIHS
jgi:hypothetical protein